MENTTHSSTEKITEEAPSLIEHEELETLINASIETLKRQKMKYGIDEVLKLVQDYLEENISQEGFDKTLQFLIDSDSVKSNSVSNRICLSIPKNNPCRNAFNRKEELQFFKNELVKEFKRLTQAFFTVISSLKNNVLTPDTPITNTPLTHSDVFINHLLDQVSFLREQIKSKDKQINSLLEHASRRDDIYLSKKVSMLPENVKQTIIEQKSDQEQIPSTMPITTQKRTLTITTL